MTAPRGLAWYARHESRLAWRDLVALATAQGRRRGLVPGLIAFTALAHLAAYFLAAPYAAAIRAPERTTLATLTAAWLLVGSAMLAQSVEAVARGLFARADLDLILSSPADVTRLFAVRIGAIAVTTSSMTLAVAVPVIDMLAWQGGWRWLSAYGVVAAMGCGATATAVVLTLALVRLLGIVRTRVAAQIVAAVIGAGFVILLQAGALQANTGAGTNGFVLLASALTHGVGPGNPLWLPARAMLGDPLALLAVVAVAVILFVASAFISAPAIAAYAMAAAGLARANKRATGRRRAFRAVAPMPLLRAKEWTLLYRDPWLVSQTLMQLLYLVPAAVMLWRGFAQEGNPTLLVPVLVMAAGQLGGGLAWLAISGEDAPDLVATAPIAPGVLRRAKFEAVIAAVVVPLSPLLAALMLESRFDALIGTAAILVAALSSTAIQWWFRGQAKRSHFRRRQTSSRIATFAEAMSSITWAVTGLLAATGSWVASTITAFVALGVLAGARACRPRREA